MAATIIASTTGMTSSNNQRRIPLHTPSSIRPQPRTRLKKDSFGQAIVVA